MSDELVLECVLILLITQNNSLEHLSSVEDPLVALRFL
jgi:hypothetical protein